MEWIESELCPWGERRLPREMYIKLFVVHFTVIGTHAHLMHLRREPRYIFSVLLMLACPIAGVALLILPLIALLIQTIVRHGDRAILNQSIGILIGGMVRDEDTDAHEAGVNWPPEFSSKLIRRVMLQLAILAQCITSIWLFARRVHHGSDALYDHRILQLAILGLSTSTMSLIHMILRPRYPSLRFQHHCPAELRYLVYLRPLLTSKHGESPEAQGMPLTPDPSGPLEAQRMLQIPLVLIDWIYACIVLSISQAFGLQIERPLSNLEIWDQMIDYELHIYYLFPFLVLAAVRFRSLLFHQSRKSFKWISFAFFGALIVFAVTIPLIICISSLSLEFLLQSSTKWPANRYLIGQAL